MRIVMVSPFPVAPPAVVGGVEAAAYSLAMQLRRVSGLELHVVSPESNIAQRTTCQVDGVTVHYLPLDRTKSPLRRLLWDVPSRVATLVGDLRPDLVHVQSLSWLASRLTWPCVLTIHGISERCVRCSGKRGAWLKSAVVALTDGRARSKVGHLICISPYVRHLLGHTRARIWDIDNPVAPEFFDVQRRPSAGRILYGGHVTPLKNIHGLIHAVARVRSSLPDVHLRIAGGGAETAYGKECQELAARLGVADSVSFLGSLTPDRLRQEMATASCLGLCSFQETAPMIVEEAMAAGLPVVASRVGGLPYMIEDGQTGRLVRPQDTQHIAEALLDVLAGGLAAEFGTRARQEAFRRFAAESVAARTHDVYRAVLSAH